MKTAVGGETIDPRWVLLSQLWRMYRLMLARYRLGHGDYVFKQGALWYAPRV